jgi:hypothetical protein
MWMHVADDRLLDVIEGTAGAREREHVAACEQCRARVAEATDALAVVADTAMPEPSPLYWEHFRAQVTRRLDEVAQPVRRRFLTPALLAAAAVIVVVSFLPRNEGRVPVAPAPTLPAWSALPAQEEDSGYVALQGLQAEPLDLAGAGACSEVNACLVSMSDEESRALADLLREELGEGKKL